MTEGMERIQEETQGVKTARNGGEKTKRGICWRKERLMEKLVGRFDACKRRQPGVVLALIGRERKVGIRGRKRGLMAKLVGSFDACGREGAVGVETRNRTWSKVQEETQGVITAWIGGERINGECACEKDG